jgi:hypothetical protein
MSPLGPPHRSARHNGALGGRLEVGQGCHRPHRHFAPVTDTGAERLAERLAAAAVATQREAADVIRSLRIVAERRSATARARRSVECVKSAK